MSAEIIKKNINRILNDRNWSLPDLERRAGTNRNIYEIIRGKNNNPSVQLIQQVAKTLNVNYKELLDEKTDNQYIQDFQLTLEAFQIIIEELKTLPSNIQISYDALTSLLNEACSYAVQSNNNIDKQFIKWLITKYYSVDSK
jgi:transcriptional regulator with XRE-family HTH domain